MTVEQPANNIGHPPPQVPADEFRALEDVMKPDVRQALFVVCDPKSGMWVKKEIRHLHWSISQYALEEHVPQEICVQWDTGRNIWLYAWFVYRFYPVAESHAFVVLELALRQKLGYDGGRSPGLAKLIPEAIRKKILFDEGIEQYRQIQDEQAEHQRQWERLRVQIPDCHLPQPESVARDPQSQRYCKMLGESFPLLRNIFAHGSTQLDPASVGLTFAICRDIINQLFDRK
jgi:hypothetical protein